MFEPYLCFYCDVRKGEKHWEDCPAGKGTLAMYWVKRGLGESTEPKPCRGCGGHHDPPEC